ncbi:hypothetical protein Esi_0900_0001 [Ectocarpus siliculosus]|uniref:Uncharacterized protein n=1 Tax=Ectocarpus siliculosus TaxID=2880 RepID=D7G8L8_ECTSI|nr:hypothetical protein Esi_0900_0001 [Ectocarpus siliculosus]|eukprot:CBJ34050.1 hypothetical protein Esi_0900_0001 [Ectocarpus siliculosus]
MRLAWQSVLLLPVLVAVTQAQSTCNDGIEGIDGNGVVCCPRHCGQCGGEGCTGSGADFGLGSESCCGGGVKSANNYCDVTGKAPCIYGSPPEGECNNGIEGIDGNGVVCCPLDCGQCGGEGCSGSGADFGLGSESCCGGGVKSANNYCDVTGKAPCIYGSPPEEALLTTVNARTQQCGGEGCSSAGAASGLGSGSCCGHGVKSSGRYCDITEEAPCIYGSPDDARVHLV